MSNFETRSTLVPEGGMDDPEAPPGNLGGPLPVATGRDVQTDDRRIGEVTVGTEDDRDLDDEGYLLNTGVSTIGNEKRSMGWEKNTVPSGAPPRPISTSGSRGAADIGRI